MQFFSMILEAFNWKCTKRKEVNMCFKDVWLVDQNVSTILCKEFCPLLHFSRCVKFDFYTDVGSEKAPVWLTDFVYVFFCCCHVCLWYKMIKINVSWVGQSITAIAHFPEMHLSNKMKENAEINDISKREQMTRMIWFLHITESNMMIFRWNILNSFWIKSDSSIVTLQLNEKCG